MLRSWHGWLPEAVHKRLAGREQLVRVAKNTGWLLFDRVAVMVAALIVGILVARYLGPERYGQLSYAVAFATLFSAIAPLGLNNIVVRDIVDAPGSRDETLGSACWLQLAAGILVVVAAVAAAVRFNPGQETIHWMVALVALTSVFASFSAIDYWFQSQIQSRYAVLGKLAALIGIPLAKIGLILLGAPVVYFAAAYTADAALVALGLVIVYHVTGQSVLRWRFRMDTARRLLADSWPLLVNSVAVVVYMKIDQVLVQQISGNTATGLYSAAVRIAEVWLFVPVIVASSAFPVLIEASQRGQAEYYTKLAWLFRLMLLLSIGAAIVISLLSGRLVRFLYGAEYAAAAPVVQVYAWSGVAAAWGVVRSRWIIIDNRQKITVYSFVATALANVALNLLMIPRFGITGAAWATLISYTLGMVLSTLLYRPQDVVAVMLHALWVKKP